MSGTWGGLGACGVCGVCGVCAGYVGYVGWNGGEGWWGRGVGKVSWAGKVLWEVVMAGVAVVADGIHASEIEPWSGPPTHLHEPRLRVGLPVTRRRDRFAAELRELFEHALRQVAYIYTARWTRGDRWMAGGWKVLCLGPRGEHGRAGAPRTSGSAVARPSLATPAQARLGYQLLTHL